MHTYEYDSTYTPSMPVVEVEVATFEQMASRFSLPALIDSGSDGSMLPIDILRQIKARRSGRVAMRTITGVRSFVDIYEVWLRVGPHTFPKVRVAADRYNPLMILGRDVLNQMMVVLNGLAATTEIHE